MPQTSDGSPMKMAVSSRDVNVKEGKKGKERTEMERKLATCWKRRGNKYRDDQTSWMQRLCNSNPALEQKDKSRLGS